MFEDRSKLQLPGFGPPGPAATRGVNAELGVSHNRSSEVG